MIIEYPKCKARLLSVYMSLAQRGGGSRIRDYMYCVECKNMFNIEVKIK